MPTIFTAQDTIPLSRFAVLIGGEPGLGKTTTCNTAYKPILFGWDKNGSSRGKGHNLVVQFQDWPDFKKWIRNKTSDGWKAYVEANDIKSVIHDTLGMLIDDYITPYVMSLGKQYRRQDGELSMLSQQGWGAVAQEFNNSMEEMLQAAGRPLVEIGIFHPKEEKNGGETVLRPDIKGGARNEIMRHCSAVAYLDREKDEHGIEHVILNCNSFYSESVTRYVKNPGEAIIPIRVPRPEETEHADFLGRELQRVLDSINSRSEAQSKAIDDLRRMRSELQAAETLQQVADIQKRIKEELSNQLRLQLTKDEGNAIARVTKGLLSEIDSQDAFDQTLSVYYQSTNNTKSLEYYVYHSLYGDICACYAGIVSKTYSIDLSTPDGLNATLEYATDFKEPYKTMYRTWVSSHVKQQGWKLDNTKKRYYDPNAKPVEGKITFEAIYDLVFGSATLEQIQKAQVDLASNEAFKSHEKYQELHDEIESLINLSSSGQ